MKLVKLAGSYMRQAEARVEDAEDAYNKENYPYAVRLSQEAVELSLKASLRLVGIEYPKIHDVSDILEISENRFPEWFRAEIPFLAETSRKLAKKRDVSFYGGEEDLVSREDAEDSVERARKTVETCKKLLEQYKQIL